MSSWLIYAIVSLIVDYSNMPSSTLRQNTGKLAELEKLFMEAGIDPEYYLVADSSSDLPYDFYRTGEENERVPIYLQMPNGELRELSRSSEIVDAISGKRRTDHKIYFPEDLLESRKIPYMKRFYKC